MTNTFMMKIVKMIGLQRRIFKMRKTFKQRYKELQDRFNELSYEFRNELDDNMRLEEENYYLKQFISFKELTDEYEYFKDNAHEADDPDNPFPPLVLLNISTTTVWKAELPTFHTIFFFSFDH